MSEGSYTRATSHPTRTVNISIAPATCKGENIRLPSEYLFLNQKALRVKFSQCPWNGGTQAPEYIQQELYEGCVEKQNKTKFKTVFFSVSPSRKYPSTSEYQDWAA